jgi:NADH-quinone oxidoreductase subunit G
VTDITCKVNGKTVTVPKGTSVLEATRAAGFDVPHFCYHPGLSKPANCRMCLVDASNSPKPIPSCYIDAAPDVEYTTESEHVREMRRAILEFILLNHPIDCPICDQSGECELQDNYFDYSLQKSRLATPKVHKPKATPLSDKIMFDGERCIVCTRCVRFTDEIVGKSEIGVAYRGEHSEISLFNDQPLSNPYQMNIVDICPVGALTSQDFRFKCRVWFMKTVESVCDQCARGCSVHLDHHNGEVMRYRPRENRQVNDWWMCDFGRMSYKGLHDNRVLAPVVRQGDKAARATWAEALEATRGALEAASPDKIAVVVSATLDCEALFAVRKLKAAMPKVRVFATGRPDGHDQDDLLIRNDKNPNRRGLTEILGELPGADVLAAEVKAGRATHVLVLGEGLPAKAVAGAPFVAAAVTHVEPVVDAAHVVLPLQTHAEHDGTYVNFEGQVQRFQGGIPGLGEALAGWSVAARLAKALGHDLGLTTDGGVFKALAREVEGFAGMTHVNLGSTGRPLGSGGPEATAAAATNAQAPAPATP